MKATTIAILVTATSIFVIYVTGLIIGYLKGAAEIGTRGTEMGNDRTELAYHVFRGGFSKNANSPPQWSALESWMRDAMRVAYLQGKLDGSTHYAAPKSAAPPSIEKGDARIADERTDNSTGEAE